MKSQIRQLASSDIPKIQEIYELITNGETLSESEIEGKMDFGDSLLCQGAEYEDKLIGFIFGEVRRGEYGETESFGSIGLLGVHPDYRNMDIGRQLGLEVIQQFKGLGINKIRTQVENSNTKLLKFFMNLGLQPASSTILELDQE